MTPWWLLAACLAPDPGDAAPDPLPVEAATASLHPDVGSVVVVRWDQLASADTWVEYHLPDEGWRATPRRATAAGAQEALILGVPYGTPIRWRVAADTGHGAQVDAEATLETGPLPEGVPEVRAASGDPDAWDPSLAFLVLSLSDLPEPGDYALFSRWWVLIVDRAGRVVWARRTPGDAVSLHPRVSADGRALLVDESTFWASYDGGQASRVHRMALDGTVSATWDTPGLHHPFTDTDDGALLWNAWADEDETIEELAADGTRRSIWRCGAYTATVGVGDTCGSNTLSWSATTGTLLFSSYTLDTVFEVDRASGDTLRTFGQLDGSWSMDPEKADLWMQHGVHWTDAGTLLVSTYRSPRVEETVVREYVVDAPALTLRETWSFGVGDGVWGRYMGEPHRLPGGNTLHNTGSMPRVREATPDGTVVWDLDWSIGEDEAENPWLGRSTPVADIYALAP